MPNIRTPFLILVLALCPLLARAGVNADLAISATGPASAVAGTNIAYDITIVNNGPGDAGSVSLTDTLPANTMLLSFVQTSGPPIGTTLPVGGTETFVLILTVNANTANGTTLTNTSNVSSSTADPNSANNGFVLNTTVTTQADVVLSMTAAATVKADTDLSYSLTVTNNGPSDAASTGLSDTLPSGTTLVSFAQNSGPPSGSTLPAGAVQTFTLVVHVNPADTDGTVLSNVASTTSITADPNSSNNNVTLNTIVVSHADLVVFTNGPVTVTAGASITYLIAILNAGPDAAQSVNLIDFLPANTSILSFVQTGGPTIGGTLPVAGVEQFTLRVRVAATAPPGATIVNTAQASSTAIDASPGDNSAQFATTVASDGIFADGFE